MKNFGLAVISLAFGLFAHDFSGAMAGDLLEKSREDLSCGSCLSLDAVAPGLSRAYVRVIQQALWERGYRPGPIDGLYGDRTRDAIIRYQQEADLAVNGVPSAALLDHLRYSHVRPTATPGAIISAETRWLQAALAAEGFDTGPLDGIRGERTLRAIAAFQEELKLPPTGRADFTTVRALQERLASPPDSIPPAVAELTWQEPNT